MKSYLKYALIFSLLSAQPFVTYAVHAQEAEEKNTEHEKKEEETKAKESDKKKDDLSETYRELTLFGDVFERVRAQYVEEVTDKELIEHALSGMLSNLDPHSSYLNEEKFNEMKVDTKGEFGGLGIEVTMESGLVKVVSPIDDTPAFRAGVMAGDYIVQIDDEPVMGMDLNDAVKKMRGKVGTEIKLEIRREGAEKPIELKLVRDLIRIQSVRSRVEGNTGYIRITTFNQNTADGVKNAIDEITKKLGNKLNGYIIDMRNNPGGLLEQAIAVSDMFLDKGEIVSTRGRIENDTRRDNATPGDLAKGLPIVVLINGGSASASEIVAGALQDHKRAIVMGTKSFGKGSVQTVVPVQGNGAMRLTTARYYTPSGRSIQAKGIEPDIQVEVAKVEEMQSNGDRFSEASLRGALENPDDTKKAEEDKKETPKEEKPEEKHEDKPDEKSDSSAKDKIDDKKPEESDAVKKDYQLSRALDLITGLNLYREMTEKSAPVVETNDDSKETASPHTPATEQ